MNWLFEAHSNVYNTSMGQRPLHHRPSSPTVEQKHQLKRGNGKFGL